MASFAKLLNNIKDGTIGKFSKVANDIATGKMIKDVIPKGNFASEVNTYFKNNQIKKAARETMTTVLNNHDSFFSPNGKDAAKIIAKFDGATSIKDVESLAKIYNIDLESIAKGDPNNARKIDVIGKAFTESMKDKKQTIPNAVPDDEILTKITSSIGAYYHNPDKTVRHRRVGATAGVYAGIAVGRRLLSGGGLTTDQYGDKDIVGIPFI